MKNSSDLGSLALRILGVLWGAAALNLLYGAYDGWVAVSLFSANAFVEHPDLRPSLIRLGMFCGIAGSLSVVVAIGLFSPRKFVWWLALLLCLSTGWWLLSESPELAFGGSVHGSLIDRSYVALYGFSFVFLLLPFIRKLFGFGLAESPSMRSSDLNRQSSQRREDMKASELAGSLQEYDQCLKNLVQALQASRDRRDLAGLIQELANRDIGRTLTQGLPPDWQTGDQILSRRVIATLEDIRKDAQLLEAFVGREGAPPALEFLLGGIHLSIDHLLGKPCTATAPSDADIQKQRSLIKQKYGKGEVITNLLELKKLGDPMAQRILLAASSDNMAEMERLIRSL